MRGAGIPLKGFANWRSQFKAEPIARERKLLYRRGPVSPPLSPALSPPVSPGANATSQVVPIVERPREGHRRQFGEATERLIVGEAIRRGGSAAEVARRYGLDQRVLRRWKQELMAASPAFVTVEIVDGTEASP